jgi:hypothetical protein
VTDEYAFLKDLDNGLLRIVKDSKAHKEKKLIVQILGQRRLSN